MAAFVRTFPKSPTPTQAKRLIDRRVRLMRQIVKFQEDSPIDGKNIPLYDGVKGEEEDEDHYLTGSSDESESDDSDTEVCESSSPDWEEAELLDILLPFQYDAASLKKKGLGHLITKEVEL